MNVFLILIFEICINWVVELERTCGDFIII
jgi:hypothetical protein